MKQNIEGGYVARIKYTHYDTNTKKVSFEFANGLYKINKISEREYLVEANILSSRKSSILMFFEDMSGYTSNSDNNTNRIFMEDNMLVHYWSSSINSDGIITNGRVELEKACVKCR